MRTTVCMAIGLAIVAGGVPASSAQDSQVVDQGKSAGTGSKTEGPQAHQGLATNKGISLAVPIGRIRVGPDLVDGDPIYVRRTTVREGMTIVEVSTTPFMPELASNQEPPGTRGTLGRPDQPAGW